MSRKAYRDEYPFTPPRERGMWRSLALAILMHGLLLLLLWHGINWHNNAPAGAEAELWTPEETVDQVQTPPPPPPATPVVAPPQPDDAEIALQQAKQKQEEAQRQAELDEQARQQKLQQEAEQRLQQQREEQARQDALKAEQQKKLLAQQQQQKLEQAKEQQQDEAKKAADALKAKQQAEAQAKAKLDKQRQANLAALKGLAGTAANGDGLAKAGTGNGSGGNDRNAYGDKIRRYVKQYVSFGGDKANTGWVVVNVNCAPDGTVLSAQVTSPSNNPAWDAAVMRAVQAASPLPRDTDGKALPRYTLRFNPNE